MRYSGRKVIVGYGTVNNIEPRIGEVRISGRDDEGKPLPGGPPQLKLLEDYDDEGRQWVCVRVEVTEEGKIDEENPKAVTCVVVANLLAGAEQQGFRGQVGLHPLAVFRESGDWFPVTYFHLQHRVATQNHPISGRPEPATARHFFWPV